MKLRTCVSPEGKFRYGVHKPRFKIINLREIDLVQVLGLDPAENPVENIRNFPAGDVEEAQGKWIFEIPNPFPFRGATYIDRNWADAKAADPLSITLPSPSATSMTNFLSKVLRCGKGGAKDIVNEAFAELPETVLLALAATSTDPEDLIRLAELSCEFVYDDQENVPLGLRYEEDAKGRQIPKVINHDLFEALVNNSYLPDIYKEVMVLRPGVQGSSEIVGEWPAERDSHVFEYLRRNSYIPWGHSASNIANDLVRYSIANLSDYDFEGLRHLYYQRTFIRFAEQLGIQIDARRKCLTLTELENLRQEIISQLDSQGTSFLQFDATLWGWNYGFDFAASGYRLHASHQQIHHQFAMVPKEVLQSEKENEKIAAYSCGDLVADFVRSYQERYNSSFFKDYVSAIMNNSRIDGKKDLPADLVVFDDDNVMLFVPKAQTSQWELQLMTTGQVGNILEADSNVRRSLNKGILTAMRVLTGLGARLITVIEYSKRIGVRDIDQRLLYSFLPKIPFSMGAFSEAESRYITGHYPEDFATACRQEFESQ
ncbi:MAG: hypothetical protein AMJ61_04805 [Desulfobacterales bacterium SG8_35_2]|nr:MAG: hypothetical protein AMJ61_04805 [Desulfobacterales bacterium SG8_35_2]